MKKVCCLIIVIYSIQSCSKIGGNDAGTAKYGEDIHYVDSSGNNLFSMSNDGQNGYWVDSVRAYDITTGSKILLNCYPNGMGFQNLNVLSTIICANHDISNQYSYTLVHLKSGIDDTIKVHLTSNTITPSTNNDSVWYNGIRKIYDSTGNILIVK
jgi:hypothetical protein